ncbi:MAG: hypothetical protein NXI20_16925 [bacterium]|nr:hypothetical protein [bacterium]
MRIKSILFIILSIVLSFVSGLGTVYLFGDFLDSGDLKKSMIRLIFGFFLIVILSIASVGYVQVKVTGIGNFWNGVAGSLGVDAYVVLFL